DLVNSLRPLSLVSSTPQSPALPWEVIERAIDLCSGNKAMLCTLALTCHQLHPRSILVLFAKVNLLSDRQLREFYDALQAQPRRQPIVHSLSFSWCQVPPFPLLSILPGLRHVTFIRILPVIRDDIHSPQSTLLRGMHWHRLTGLRSLTIHYARFQTRTAFLHFLLAF
ncbi:hypothetical protein BD309DRAFT_817008, partial [Dichomitus squalens]